MRITHVPIIRASKRYHFEHFIDLVINIGYREPSYMKSTLDRADCTDLVLTLNGNDEQELLERSSQFKALCLCLPSDLEDSKIYVLNSLKERYFNLDNRVDFDKALDFMEANIIKWDNQLITEKYDIC